MKNIKKIFTSVFVFFLMFIPELVLACNMGEACSYSVPEHGKIYIWLNKIQKGQKYNCSFSVSGLDGDGILRLSDISSDDVTLIFNLKGQGNRISLKKLSINASYLNKDFGNLFLMIKDEDQHYNNNGMHSVNIVCEKEVE